MDYYKIRFFLKGDVTDEQVKGLFFAIEKYSKKKELSDEGVIVNSGNKTKEILDTGEIAKAINSIGKIKGTISYTSFLDFLPKEEKQKNGGLSLTITVEDGFLVISLGAESESEFDAETLGKEEPGIKNQKMLISLGKDIYNIFHPFLGLSGNYINLDTDVSDVLNHMKFGSVGFDWYFFGKDFVKKYGKVQLLKTFGAWEIDAFSDGGIFIALRTAGYVNLSEKESEKFRDASRRLAGILGVKAI